MRRLLWMVAVTLSTACAHRATSAGPGPEVWIPAGLDSAQMQAWTARQRQACHGRLVILSDLGPFAVQCMPDSSTQHPPPMRRHLSSP